MSDGILIPRGSGRSRERQTRSSSTPRGERDFRPAWFAGIDISVLNQIRSDWCFYDTLGTAVAILCTFSGLSATLAVSYVMQADPLELWWVWLLWTPCLICIERLILQMPNGDSWLSSVGSFLWRAAISLLLAFLFAEPLVMRLHEPEIQAQLNLNTANAITRAYSVIDRDLKPKLEEVHAELRSTRHRRAELEAKLAGDRKRQVVAQQLGQTQVVVANAALANLHEQWLDGIVKRNMRRQPELHKQIAALAAEKGRRKEEAKRAITQGIGFEARVEALSGVVKKWPSTSYAVWGLRLLLLLLDLTPLVAIIAYMHRSGSKPYEARRAAAWEWDSLPAQEVEEAVRVEKQRLKDQARADIRVNQAKIATDADGRIVGSAGGVRPPGFGEDDPPLSAMTLDEFVDNMEIYEDRAVDVPDELRRSALLGLGLIGLTALVGFLWASLTASTLSGGWLLAVALVLAVALCAYSRGFSRAPAWTMRPILAVFIAGLVLPLFIAVVNA